MNHLNKLPEHMVCMCMYAMHTILNWTNDSNKLDSICYEDLEDDYIIRQYNIGYLANKEYVRSVRSDNYSGVDLFK